VSAKTHVTRDEAQHYQKTPSCPAFASSGALTNRIYRVHTGKPGTPYQSIAEIRGYSYDIICFPRCATDPLLPGTIIEMK
jgi:hypothetical protein